MTKESFLTSWKEGIERKISLANKSITWWEKQLDVLFEKLDKTEDAEWYADKDKDMEEITDGIHSLMSRGKFEHENLDHLQKEMDDFLDSINEKISDIAMRLDINVTL